VVFKKKMIRRGGPVVDKKNSHKKEKKKVGVFEKGGKERTGSHGKLAGGTQKIPKKKNGRQKKKKKKVGEGDQLQQAGRSFVETKREVRGPEKELHLVITRVRTQKKKIKGNRASTETNSELLGKKKKKTCPGGDKRRSAG